MLKQNDVIVLTEYRNPFQDLTQDTLKTLINLHNQLEPNNKIKKISELKKLIEGESVWLIVKEDENRKQTVIGFLSYYIEDNYLINAATGLPYVFIHFLVLDEHHRNHCIGTYTMKQFMNDYPETPICLLSDIVDHKAHKFYESFNFQYLDDIMGYRHLCRLYAHIPKIKEK